MRRTLDKKGFTLIEMIIVMAIMLFVITAASRLLTAMLGSFKQQTKVAESSIESTVGLTVLTRDLRGVGYGLPYKFDEDIGYTEAATGGIAEQFNDAPDEPRAILWQTPGGSLNGSDYLVIKSLTVAENAAGGKFSYLRLGNDRPAWAASQDEMADDDWIMVLYMDSSGVRHLAIDPASGEWALPFKPESKTEELAPPDNTTTRFIYGITTKSVTENTPRFPFNRADYYISSLNVPDRCAGSREDPPLTGVLVKTVLSQKNGLPDLDGDGKWPDELPLLDCVMDMQVAVRVDKANDGNVTFADGDYVSSLTPEQLRQQVRDIRVYILAHDGQFDPTYEHPDQTIWVGEAGVGQQVDLSVIGPNWMRYRWRLHTFVVKPLSLRF